MKKISPEKFYHIYLKDNCIFNCLQEEDFKVKFETIKAMVGLMKTDFKEDDITYEVVETLVTTEESSY
tara:strand:+ start:103 stop:306 length:204 start_codon:yes stop_codon:yes gene_type:complete